LLVRLIYRSGESPRWIRRGCCSITGSTITGSTITGSTIGGSTIGGGTITGSTITGSTIGGGTINSGTIDGGSDGGSMLGLTTRIATHAALVAHMLGVHVVDAETC
jgi:hypothetical protein